MKLRTTIAVTHVDVVALNSPDGTLANGQVPTKTGIVTMSIGDYNYYHKVEGDDLLEVAYAYRDADDNILPTKNNNRQEVKGDLHTISVSFGNTGTSFSEHLTADVKSYAIAEMLKLFTELTDASEIEEIIE